LKEKITAMRTNVQEQNITYTIGDNTQAISVNIRMPLNCPPPPNIPIPPTVIPCLEASANAARISKTVAVIDGKKADHEWNKSLKNTNYKLLAKLTQCSSGENFPCEEVVLAHHPSTVNGSLHCFTENGLTSDITIDHTCFKGALYREYYNEYRTFLITLTNRWIELLSTEVWPGSKCYSYAINDGSNMEHFTEEKDYYKRCDIEKNKDQNATRDDTNICGSTLCCDNFEDHELKCYDFRKDTSKGNWISKITGGSCIGDKCMIDDLKVQILFSYTVRTDNINIETGNKTVVGLSVSNIIRKLSENASDVADICKLNQNSSEDCGLSGVDWANKYTTGQANYCKMGECCTRQTNPNGNINYKCTDSGSGCDIDQTNMRFQFDAHAKCISDNQSTNANAKQIEILPGELTSAGEAIGLEEGKSITDNGA